MQADMDICCRAQNSQDACCQQSVLTSTMESLLSTEKMGGREKKDFSPFGHSSSNS